MSTAAPMTMSRPRPPLPRSPVRFPERWVSPSTGWASACPPSPCRRTPGRARSSTTRCITAAVIATLSRLHGLKPLTRRDNGANDLFSVVNLDEPRDPSSWPIVQPRHIPVNTAEDQRTDLKHGAHKDKPLSPPGRGLLGLLLARYGRGDSEEPETYARRVPDTAGPRAGPVLPEDRLTFAISAAASPARARAGCRRRRRGTGSPARRRRAGGRTTARAS